MNHKEKIVKYQYDQSVHAVDSLVYYKPLSLITKIKAVRIMDNGAVVYFLNYGERSANADEIEPVT